MSLEETRSSELLAVAGELSVPVDPRRIAAHLGVRVAEAAFNDELSGLLVRDSEMTAIVVRESEPETRKRFTIAHELGHFVLNHPGDLFVDTLTFNRRDNRVGIAIDPLEMQANAFAAALLMPANALRTAVAALVESKTVIDRTHLIDTLARQFEVSTQALEFRLISLGFLSPA